MWTTVFCISLISGDHKYSSMKIYPEYELNINR